MTFELTTMTEVLIRSTNNRAENHGNDLVPAVDLSLLLTGSNDILNLLEPGLRDVLYRSAREGEDVARGETADLPGTELTDAPVLRSAVLGMPIVIDREIVGRDLVIDYGAGGRSNITLSTCSVNSFKADCKEGGTVELQFRVQCSGVSEKALGKLGTLVKHKVRITLKVSESPQQGLPESSKGTVVDATAAFIAANA